MIIRLQVNSSPKNQVTKNITLVEEMTGTLKNETSIIDPVIIVEADLYAFRNVNYLTIPSFGRSYFVKNIRSITNDMVEFSCHVDVLSSFAAEIRANTAIVKRNEIVSNLFLNDGFFKVYQNPHIVMWEFPNGFTEHEFVLAMAGS